MTIEIFFSCTLWHIEEHILKCIWNTIKSNLRTCAYKWLAKLLRRGQQHASLCCFFKRLLTFCHKLKEKFLCSFVFCFWQFQTRLSSRLSKNLAPVHLIISSYCHRALLKGCTSKISENLLFFSYLNLTLGIMHLSQ